MCLKYKLQLWQKTQTDFLMCQILVVVFISRLLFVFHQEALWREEVVKQKLAALQESTSNLMNSSNKIWTVRVFVCMHTLFLYIKHTMHMCLMV